MVMSALLVAEQVLVVTSASVSFAGCAFIFFTWKSFSAPNYLSRRIVASLGLAGLVTAFGFSMSIVVNGIGQNYERTESLCYLQAFTLQYFYLASYLWTACFAFHLYQIIVKRNEYPEQFLWLYRAIGWGLPGLVLLYLVLRQLTGHLGVGPADRRWCWIAAHATRTTLSSNYSSSSTNSSSSAVDRLAWRREGARQQLLLFYAPITAVFVFNAAVYWRIVRFLAHDPMAARFQRKVALYLGIFFLCSIWGAINRGVQFASASHAPNTALSVLECVCDPLQPLLNALAYGTTRQSLDAYRERFCASWFYASLPSSDDDESGVDSSTLLTPDDDVDDDVDNELSSASLFGGGRGHGSARTTKQNKRKQHTTAATRASHLFAHAESPR